MQGSGVSLSAIAAFVRTFSVALDQLLEVGFDFRKTRVVGSFEADACRALGIEQLDHAFDDVMHVDRLEGDVAVRPQDTINKVSEAVGLSDDHRGVLALIGVLQLPVQQLRRSPNASQRILDFVRETPGKFAHRLL